MAGKHRAIRATCRRAVQRPGPITKKKELGTFLEAITPLALLDMMDRDEDSLGLVILVPEEGIIRIFYCHNEDFPHKRKASWLAHLR